ncbi:hypothetical protein Pcac1_g6321 [Phytophthora cactorum]|nr:hypothetical protein Pcac1_g6321 [Phytophthora cactorum]
MTLLLMLVLVLEVPSWQQMTLLELLEKMLEDPQSAHLTLAEMLEEPHPLSLHHLTSEPQSTAQIATSFCPPPSSPTS